MTLRVHLKWQPWRVILYGILWCLLLPHCFSNHPLPAEDILDINRLCKNTTMEAVGHTSHEPRLTNEEDGQMMNSFDEDIFMAELLSDDVLNDLGIEMNIFDGNWEFNQTNHENTFERSSQYSSKILTTNANEMETTNSNKNQMGPSVSTRSGMNGSECHESMIVISNVSITRNIQTRSTLYEMSTTTSEDSSSL